MQYPLHTHDIPLALHFRYSHITPPTALDELLHAASLACLAIGDRAGLIEWARGALRALIPHEKAVIGVGTLALDRWRIDRRECVDFSVDYFDGYVPRSPSRHSPLMERWIESRAPQAAATNEVNDGRHDQWLENALRNGIANSVMDGYEHGTMGIFSFAKLFNVTIPLDEAARRLHHIAPHLKEIHTRIADSEMGRAKALPQIALTPAQKEILTLLRHHKTNGEIAQLLGKQPTTVKTQVQDMLRRTGFSSRHALAASAY